MVTEFFRSAFPPRLLFGVESDDGGLGVNLGSGCEITGGVFSFVVGAGVGVGVDLGAADLGTLGFGASKVLSLGFAISIK